MSLSKTLIPSSIKRRLRILRFTGRPVIYWAKLHQRNWGDDLNPWLFTKLTGKQAAYCPHNDISRLLMAGSILQCSGSSDLCWGTGLLSPDFAKGIRLKQAFACRGPLTARALEQNMIEPPKVFGDPGILCAGYAAKASNKKSKLGIIPHYADRLAGECLARELNAKLISVSLDIEEFILNVSEVECIASSSLHGLICAESLSIPATWIQFSNNIQGGFYKYRDYYSGTGRDGVNIEPIDLRNSSANYQNIREYSWPEFDLAEYCHALQDSFPLHL